jgi:hypothetical protein
MKPIASKTTPSKWQFSTNCTFQYWTVTENTDANVVHYWMLLEIITWDAKLITKQKQATASEMRLQRFFKHTTHCQDD